MKYVVYGLKYILWQTIILAIGGTVGALTYSWLKLDESPWDD